MDGDEHLGKLGLRAILRLCYGANFFPKVPLTKCNQGRKKSRLSFRETALIQSNALLEIRLTL